MKPVFKTCNQGQITLFPFSLDSKISQYSPVSLGNQIVDNLDISKIIDTYKGGGTSAYPSRVMLKIVIFTYLCNLYSCRKIEDAVKNRKKRSKTMLLLLKIFFIILKMIILSVRLGNTWKKLELERVNLIVILCQM